MRPPGEGSLLLDGVGVEVVLPHVVAQVAGVDAEEVRRLLAHARGPAVGLEQQLRSSLLSASRRLSSRSARLVPSGKGAPALAGARSRSASPRAGSRIMARRSRCAAPARCPATVGAEAGEHGRGKLRRRAPEALRDLVDEVARQERDVVPALAQGRNVDPDDVEAVEEVRAEPALLNLRLEVAVGRGHHANVDPGRLLVAEALELAVLDGVQQLGLPRGGMVPTSSRKSVPRSASWKRPSRSDAAPANDPFRWPKNSLSHISRGTAAQLTFTKGPEARGERACSRRARSSFRIPTRR